MNNAAPSYRGYRFPPEIISHAIWLYHSFCLSFRDVEDLLAERFVTIRGQRHYLWRAVDQDGDVIDILVQPRRDRRAAERFFRKLLKGQGREPLREQSGRGFPPTDPTAGARHAKVQVVCSSATILVGARNHPECVPCRTTPAAGSQLPEVADSRPPCLERGDVCLTNSEVDDSWAGSRSADAKLTMPPENLVPKSDITGCLGLLTPMSSSSIRVLESQGWCYRFGVGMAAKAEGET